MQVISGKIEVGIEKSLRSSLFLSNQTVKEFEMTTNNLPSNQKSIKICAAKGCVARGIYSISYCPKHYKRWKKYGNPNTTTLKCGEGVSKEERFWSKVIVTANAERCWEWQGSIVSGGYGGASYKNKSIRAHVLAWYFTYRKFPTKFLLHSCDNPPCVNPNHLREGTHQQNMDDAVKRNRFPKGEASYLAKLTNEKVIQIRELLKTKITQTAIALQFGIDQSTVSYIKSGRNWRHVI